MLDLVPPKKMLDAYKKKEKDWKNYEKDFFRRNSRAGNRKNSYRNIG